MTESQPDPQDDLRARIAKEIANHWGRRPNDDGVMFCNCGAHVKFDRSHQAMREHTAAAILALVQPVSAAQDNHEQARADAFAEAIDRLNTIAHVAPDPERAPGLNFAIGALMAMRDRAARAARATTAQEA